LKGIEWAGRRPQGRSVTLTRSCKLLCVVFHLNRARRVDGHDVDYVQEKCSSNNVHTSSSAGHVMLEAKLSAETMANRVDFRSKQCRKVLPVRLIPLREKPALLG